MFGVRCLCCVGGCLLFVDCGVLYVVFSSVICCSAFVVCCLMRVCC